MRKVLMSTIEGNTEKLVTDLKRVVRDSEELLQTTAGAVGDKAHEIRERLSETLETANRACRALEGKTIQRAEAVDKLLRKHPYQSLGLALGLGFFIGLLITR